MIKDMDKKGQVTVFVIIAIVIVAAVIIFFKHDRTVTTTYANSPDDLKAALTLIAEKNVPVTDMITHRISLDEIQYGFDLVQNGTESLKVIVEPN